MISISWSALRRFEECKQRSYRRGQGKAVPTDQRVFVPGILADRVMRAWLTSEDPQPGQMSEMVFPMLKRFTDPTEADLLDEDLGVPKPIKWRGLPRDDMVRVGAFVRKVVKELEPYLIEYVLPYPYMEEMPFRSVVMLPGLDGEPEPVELIGRIDIVVRPSRFDLFDLKATTDDAYAAKVRGQGVFYDIGFGLWFGNTAEPERFAFLVPAAKEKLVWVRVSDDDRRNLMVRVLRFAHAKWRNVPEDWEASPGVHCWNCEVKHVCDAFSVEVVQDQQGKNRVQWEATARRRAPYLKERSDDGGGQGSAASSITGGAPAVAGQG